VSNLSFTSKILEKVVAQRLEEHLEVNDLWDPYQSAYRQNHSTETALLKVQSNIAEALDSGSMVVLLMIDLSAAFDTLDHATLIKRFEHSFGITGEALQWVSSYLANRSQSVTINGEQSEESILQFGVPQGSVLGPKEYCMYTRPVGTIVRQHGMSHMSYADDTQAYEIFASQAHWPDTTAKIQSCMSAISSWMSNNSLKMNADKFEFIVFHPKRQQFDPQEYSLTLANTTYQPVLKVRNLGVVQDSQLKMEQQVSSVCRSCYNQIRSIGRIRNFINTDTCRTLVQALVTSRLDYANSLLLGITKAQTDRLQRLQNCAARLITRTPMRDHMMPVLKELHWLPAQYRPKFKVLLFTYKALHGSAPSYLADMITEYKPARALRSANQGLLVVPEVRTLYGERSFRYSAATLWNDLPLRVKDAPNVHRFKRLLKAHLFQKAFD